MDDFIKLSKALSDPNRARVLLALREGGLFVCQIKAFLGLAVSTVSNHMSILREAGLVRCRKEGLLVRYSLLDKPSPEAAGALEWLFSSLGNGEMALDDARRVEEITSLDISEFCRSATDGGASGGNQNAIRNEYC